MKMTVAEYWKNFDWLRSVWPEWVLIPVMERGYSYPNCIYLSYGLRQMAYKMDAPRVAVKQLLRSHSPEQIKLWFMQKRTLYGQRAKLSNRFHECSTDAQRAAVSEDIERVQEEIEKVQKVIRAWQEKGELPQKAKRGNPEMDLLLLNVQRARAAIYDYRRNLRVELNKPDHPKKAKKIAEYEQKLRDKTNEYNRRKAEYDQGLG
jgi:membrane-bound lytic murein transglycosylase